MMIMTTMQTGIDGSAIFRHTLRVQLIRTDSGAPGGSGPKYRTAARIRGPGRPAETPLLILPLRRAAIHKAERPTTKLTPAKIPITRVANVTAAKILITQVVSATMSILTTVASQPGLRLSTWLARDGQLGGGVAVATG